MRISTFQHAAWTKRDMMRVQAEVAKNQQKVSSGKKHLRMSDSPLDTGKSLAIGHTLRQIEQMQRDITDSKNMLSTTETALTGIQEALDRANALVIQSLNGTQSKEDLRTTATEVEALVKQVIYLGNTQYDGRYIFGGSDYEQPPFQEDGTYAGGNKEVSWNIHESYSVTVFHNGNETIAPALQTLQNIYSQLKNGDIEGLKSSLEANKSNMEAIISSIGEVGSTSATVQSFDDMLHEQKITLTEKLSSVEDVDLAEAISDLSYMNATYQATLQVVSTMNKVNILNYM
ncbi:MAG: flagellar hook-associated protein 3 [Ectobacillus sp.]